MFESAKLKLERADKHIADLEREFKAFKLSKPYTCGVHKDKDTGEAFVEIVLNEQLLDTIPLIIGDALNNLRCVLDHVTWEIVGWDKGTQDRKLQFPIKENRKFYEKACKEIKTPSSFVKDFFLFWEAFPEGRGEDLYILNKLNNTDKHRVITTFLRATQHPDFSIINFDGTRLTMEGNIIISRFKKGRIRITNVPTGTQVEFPNGTDCSLSIFFRNGYEGEVFETLKALRKVVFHVIEYAEIYVCNNTKVA